ncbi:hypothetical protein ILUMI_00982 [Ignelater luminosus]|uniref:tRNA (guanine(26)-N(2))-dimethyltransferase n=1 Tax=Ignelater luminosus TaxID=2038154 RepID=A0A8K0GHW4_IGNLU|nr:hypothetical protein ILUMI_00982 [Ignelater luminosus]
MLKRILRLGHVFKPRQTINFSYKNMQSEDSKEQVITEGLATVKTSGNVFYNQVQEFNRDLSISVLNVFSRQYQKEKIKKQNDNSGQHEEELKVGIKNENGITILEALSATGLRSIRYAKEIAGVKQIVANDISRNAVENIKLNVNENNVEDLITVSENDAIMLMYQHRLKERFDAIDLDPYGCPSRFLDSAVQAINDGGLLLVTATDMAVLAGNSPETCYSKYGAISLRIKSCHEMALRILLQCIESHANRYGRYIEPLLSLSADFYIRVFVRVHTSAHKCKFTTSKLSMVYQCTGCDTFTLQPLGIVKTSDDNKQIKFKLPVGPSVGSACEHCGNSFHLGGPIWSAPIHCMDFVQEILQTAPTHLKTLKRIHGVLSVITEELPDCPLYFILERLSGTLHVETPPILAFRSALLNAGYHVSFTHTHKTSIKTNAPAKVIWDIMRCWESKHPLKEKRKAEKSPGNNILAKQPEKQYCFDLHRDANPQSRREGFVRFQENPLPFWGPGVRSTAMVGDDKMLKSRLNQGKRKRDQSEDKEEK